MSDDVRLDAIEQGFRELRDDLHQVRDLVAELITIERAREAVEEALAPQRETLKALPARVDALEADPKKAVLVQVMDHPKFAWVVAASVIISLALAGGVTWTQLEEYVPRVTVGAPRLDEPAPVVAP